MGEPSIPRRKYTTRSEAINLLIHELIEKAGGSPNADLLEEIIELTAPDAEAFGCQAEVAHTRSILTRGTSADRQTQIWREAVAAGATPAEALKRVVDWLIAETTAGF